MCTREDLLRLTLQEGCWYNLRSRKALEDSKGHTTKSPLVTKKTAAWMRAWLRLRAAPSTRISCDAADANELRDGWAAWSSVPGSAARARVRVVTLE